MVFLWFSDSFPLKFHETTIFPSPKLCVYGTFIEVRDSPLLRTANLDAVPSHAAVEVPPGNQTWLTGTFLMNGGLIRKITDFYGPIFFPARHV